MSVLCPECRRPVDLEPDGETIAWHRDGEVQCPAVGKATVRADEPQQEDFVRQQSKLINIEDTKGRQ
jgi:endogenous inhibitor of DNA gyrase (YacG/DUF329 family)